MSGNKTPVFWKRLQGPCLADVANACRHFFARTERALAREGERFWLNLKSQRDFGQTLAHFVYIGEGKGREGKVRSLPSLIFFPMRREGQENYGLPRNKFRLAMHGSPDIKLSDHTHVTSTPRGMVIPVVEDEEIEVA